MGKPPATAYIASTTHSAALLPSPSAPKRIHPSENSHPISTNCNARYHNQITTMSTKNLQSTTRPLNPIHRPLPLPQILPRTLQLCPLRHRQHTLIKLQRISSHLPCNIYVKANTSTPEAPSKIAKASEWSKTPKNPAAITQATR
jgi:hypothetical protein